MCSVHEDIKNPQWTGRLSCYCRSVTPAGSRRRSVYISLISKCVTTRLGHTAGCMQQPHIQHVWLFDVRARAHKHTEEPLGVRGMGGHSCLLFKEEEETCQEKIVENRKLSWLESSSFLKLP